MRYSIVFSLLSVVALTGCGGSSGSKSSQIDEQENKNQYQLSVSTSGSFKDVYLSWMGLEQTLYSGQDYQFTASANQFIEPNINPPTSATQCESTLSKRSELDYELKVNCVTKAVMIYADIGPGYALKIRYGEELTPFNSEDIFFDFERGVQPTIVDMEGPMTCELFAQSEGMEYKLECQSFSFGRLDRKLALIRDNQPPEIVWQNQENRLIRQGYEWFDEAIWFTSWRDEGYKVHKLEFENGQPSRIRDFNFDARTIKTHEGQLYALSTRTLAQQLAKLVEGNWETQVAYPTDTEILSDFLTNDEGLYFSLRSTQGHALGQIKNGRYISPKSISNQIEIPSILPPFKYDGRNFFVGYKGEDELVVNYLDTILSYRDEAIFEYANVDDAIVWKDTVQNDYLFYLKDNQIMQFEVNVNGQQSSQAFDLSVVNSQAINWLGGDITTLLAGTQVKDDDRFGTLTYVREGDIEVTEGELQARLATNKELYVLLPNWKYVDSFWHHRLHSRISTRVVAKSGYVLVYVGDNTSDESTGDIWVLSAYEAHKVFSDVTWGSYIDENFYIDGVSDNHILVQGTSDEFKAISINQVH